MYGNHNYVALLSTGASGMAAHDTLVSGMMGHNDDDDDGGTGGGLR